jgi:hypothetical protein
MHGVEAFVNAYQGASVTATFKGLDGVPNNTALIFSEGKATLARTPDHKLDWAFLRPEEPAKFTEGTGKFVNTVTDFSYFEMINDPVQKEPVGLKGLRFTMFQVILSLTQTNLAGCDVLGIAAD